MRKIAEASMRDRRLSLGARLIRKMWLSVAACVLAGTAWADTSRSSSALAPQAVTRSILIGNRLTPGISMPLSEKKFVGSIGGRERSRSLYKGPREWMAPAERGAAVPISPRKWR